MSLRNVIYYNSSNDQISLAGIAQLPYTDVIIANIQPTPDSLTLQGYGPAFDKNLHSNIQALQSAGKNVLISFGGANNATLLSGYQSYAQNVGGLVDDIVNNWVMEYGFNGVDIDYEDDSGFDQPGQPASYDGAGFLVALTNGLYQALPSGQNIITHAPSPPFFDPQGGYYAANTQIAAYTQIWQQAGNQIAWINCQFYDNQAYDHTAALKVYWYQQIAEITGPQQLLVGALVGDPALYEKNDQDEGYITLDDMINNVIAPLKAQYGSQFGGVMGWEFWQDGPPTYGTAGAWANGIAQALGASTTPNLYVFHQGEENDGQLWYSSNDGTNWTADTQVQNLGMSGSPSAVLWAGGISVFHQGLGNNGSLWYSYFDGTNWYPDTLVPNLGLSGSPSCVVR
jgi:chitinase